MAMNLLFAKNIQARNEISKLSNIATRMISYQSKGPAMGSIQDHLVGMAELTREGVVFDKWHAMQLLAQINSFTKTPDFSSQRIYNNREIISLTLPNINIKSRKPNIYMAQYSPFIKYDPKDISVNIENGYLKSGIIDKACIGIGAKGGIYHVVNNQHGNKKALEMMHIFSQFATQYFYNHGFTVGIDDLILTESALKKIKINTEKMIFISKQITEKLNKRELHPPIGVSLLDFYESEQLAALSPGDDFVIPILADIDFNTNKLVKMVFTGSKGNPTNIIAINAALGNVTINGKRPIKHFGYQRTSPYFTRYDMEPRANGYVGTSYMEGLQPDVFAFVAGEARHSIISNALSTSVTGNQNRLSIKNLESMVVDNLRKSIKGQNIIQPLYAESGIDPRKYERVKFPTAMISDAEMNEWHSKPTDFAESGISKAALKQALDDEFQVLVRDRDMYRTIYMKLEENNPGGFLIDDSQFMPVNVPQIINDIVYGYSKNVAKQKLNPIICINKTMDLCDVIGYAYYNDIQEKAKRLIPEFIKAAMTLLQIMIRSYLSTAYLLRKGVTTTLLDIIIDKIRVVFKKSLIDYGMAIGIIAAQCISEPMTQFILDSKHRTGQGGTKTNAIVRMKEIFGVYSIAKMKNPFMIIMPLKEHEKNKMKIQEIANHIEMMKFSRFIHASYIFFEEYGKPVHPKYQHESHLVKEFEKHNFGTKPPSDLTKWCIRFVLNKESMIIWSMKLDTIIMAIRSKFPSIHLVYAPENAKTIIIRCYLRNNMLKLGASEDTIIGIMKSMQNIVIRGTNGIMSAKVIELAKSQINQDGSISAEKIYAIDTDGTNLEAMLENPYIDVYRTQSDSLTEMAEIYGIEAARNKIILELVKVMNLSKDQCMIFADEMTFSGRITSIQKTGLQTREMSNVTLRLSFQSPVQVVENAAVDNLVDRISGVSGPLIMGSTPNVGTTYNKIMVNREFIKEMGHRTVNIEDIL